MPFDDFAEVIPGLYVGSHPEPESPFEDFLGADVVICLAGGPAIPPRDKLLIHWPVKDGPTPDPLMLHRVARFALACIEDGRVVYIHCMSGVNHSVLVAAVILIEDGWKAEDAITHVREARKGSLSDEYADFLAFNLSPSLRPQSGEGSFAPILPPLDAPRSGSHQRTPR